MEANLSFEKKSSRAPLTEGCCRLAFPCVRPSAGTASFCSSSRQTWISARPLYSVVQLLICSRPFQSKNSNVRGEVGGRERQGKRGRKKNWGTEGKCRRDKHTSSLSSKEVVSSEQPWVHCGWGFFFFKRRGLAFVDIIASRILRPQ